jgi:hypothetical protein
MKGGHLIQVHFIRLSMQPAYRQFMLLVKIFLLHTGGYGCQAALHGPVLSWPPVESAALLRTGVGWAVESLLVVRVT